MADSVSAEAVSIVIITHNRAKEVVRTVGRALELKEAARVIVIDNASADDTVALLRALYPRVLVVRLCTNLGAAARNVGLAIAHTRFVALSDDDTWWEPGALTRAQRLLEAHPRLAVLCAQVVVEPQGQIDPTSVLMEHSPLDDSGVPGIPLLGFLAGASVVRREAMLQAGGFDPRLFIGGEEALLALDLAARGWRMAYALELVVHHQPSKHRNAHDRRHLLLRNALYIACLRLPLSGALREGLSVLIDSARARCVSVIAHALADALPWLLQGRRVIPPEVERARRLVRFQVRRARSDVAATRPRSPPALSGTAAARAPRTKSA